MHYLGTASIWCYCLNWLMCQPKNRQTKSCILIWLIVFFIFIFFVLQHIFLFFMVYINTLKQRPCMCLLNVQYSVHLKVMTWIPFRLLSDLSAWSCNVSEWTAMILGQTGRNRRAEEASPSEQAAGHGSEPNYLKQTKHVDHWERTQVNKNALVAVLVFTLYSVVSWHPVQDTLWALLYPLSVRYEAEAFFVEFHLLVLCPLLLQTVLQPALLLRGIQLLLLSTGFFNSSSRCRLSFFLRHDGLTGECLVLGRKYWSGIQITVGNNSKER